MIRHFLTWDCLLHAAAGAAAAFGLAYVLPWWAAVLAVTAFGFGREIQQAWDDSDGDRWPWQWSQHRWAEALAWVPGALAGGICWMIVA